MANNSDHASRSWPVHIGPADGVLLGKPGIGKTQPIQRNLEIDRLREQGRPKIKPPLENTVQFQSHDAIFKPDQPFPTTRVVR